MTGSPGRAGVGTRALHAAVFGSSALLALWASAPEVAHLASALSRPWHAGAPPHPASLAGFALALAALLGMVAAWARSRPVPLVLSSAALGGLALALVGLARVPEGRSGAAANLVVLRAGRALQEAALEDAKRTGHLPAAPEDWERLWAGFDAGPGAVRDRIFRATGVVLCPRVDCAVAPGLRPGTLLAYTADGGAHAVIQGYGFGADGGVGPLLDERGTPLELGVRLSMEE